MVLHCLISRRVPVCIIYSYISVLIDDDNITYRGSKTRYENDGIEILGLAHCRQLFSETPIFRTEFSCRFLCSNTILCSAKRSSSFFRNSILNFLPRIGTLLFCDDSVRSNVTIEIVRISKCSCHFRTRTIHRGKTEFWTVTL